jgi:glucose-1-phosphate thymidylyltransferase
VKGLIMAGGSGTRLFPLTKSINKHLLPVFDKPLIYYSLSTLMLAGIRDICIVSSPDDLTIFESLLQDGTEFGISISYLKQNEPRGIAQGLIVAKEFLIGHKVALILGDNLFHGKSLGRELTRFQNISGAQIFAYQVSKPSDYGVVEIDPIGGILSIEEKPSTPKSNFAITGLYFYDERACEFASELKPSKRGELEITDLNKKYLELNELNVTKLSTGTAWLDTGTFENLYNASSYIKIMQERQNFKIGDPLEVALNQGWI